MQTKHTVRIGDRVEAGTPGTEDHDRGTVTEIAGNLVTVAWDSLVSTTQPADLLTVISRAKAE